jgi:hypothetical protein
MRTMSAWDDGDSGRAPICPYWVTALPEELPNVIDSSFVCDNAECDAYGDRVEARGTPWRHGR